VLGVWVGNGQAAIENTTIDLKQGGSATGVEVGSDNGASQTTGASLDGVTIADGGPGSNGIRVSVGVLGGSDAFTATARNTVIDGVAHPIVRFSDAGSTANVITDYSNYNPAGDIDDSDLNNDMASGSGAITATNTTSFAPLFVDPATDLHLQPTSPLIDIGDPAAPAAGTVDLDGNPRAVLAKPGCFPRRDIGAYEFIPAAALSPSGCPIPPPPATTKPRCRKGFKLKKVKHKKKKKCVKKKKRRR
jgi:hypothetical protein